MKKHAPVTLGLSMVIAMASNAAAAVFTVTTPRRLPSLFHSDRNLQERKRKPMSKISAFACAMLVTGMPSPILAAPGDPCPGFSIGTGLKKTSSWFGGALRALAVQPDGRILLAGDFEAYNGTPRKAIVRILSDGSTDPTFDPHDGISGDFETIDQMVLLPDGKIMIAGDFPIVNGKFQAGVARLCANGSLDPTFEGVINEPSALKGALVVQPDGKIIVGGQFTRANANSPNVNNIARFSPDGALDATFRISSYSGVVYGLYLMPTDDLMIRTSNQLRKFRPDLQEDLLFNPSLTNVAVLYQERNGKFFVTGPGPAFTSTLVRLNSDGYLDSSFDGNAAAVALRGRASAMTVQPDGKYLVASSTRLIRLNQDGSVDSTLNIPLSVEASFLAILPGSTCVLVANSGGSLKLLDLGDIQRGPTPIPWPPANASPVACTDYWTGAPTVAGLPDWSFDLEAHSTLSRTTLNVAAADGSGGIYIGGGYDFTLSNSNGFRTYRIAKMRMDGSPDTTFQFSTNLASSVKDIVPISDGKTMVAIGRQVLRLLPNGAIDQSFSQEIDDGTPSCLLKLSDGRILVGGSIHSRSRGWVYLVRLLQDGTLDGSFNSNIPAAVNRMALLPNGQVLSAAGSKLFRLNASGVSDNTFTADTTNIYRILALAVDSQRRILIGGVMYTKNAYYESAFLRRLLPDGRSDSSFTTFLGPENYNGGVAGSDALYVEDIKIQSDGKILCAGGFEQVDGFLHAKIARLHENGRLDKTFLSEFSWQTDTTINRLLSMPDGRILTVGTYDAFYAVMLHNDPRLYDLSNVDSLANFKFRAVAERTYYVEGTPNLESANWSRRATVDGDNQIHLYSEPTRTANKSFFRLNIVTPPRVDYIERLGPTNQAVASGLLTYRVWFNKHVNNVDTADFTPITSGDGLAATVAAVEPSPGRTVNVTLTTSTTNGSVRLDVSVPGASIVDDAGNALRSPFASGETYLVDSNLPRVVSITRLSPSAQVTSASIVVYRVTFSEHVNGLNTSDFTPVAVSGSLTNVTVSAISADSGTAIDVRLNTGSGAGALRLDVLVPTALVMDDSRNRLVNSFKTGETYKIER